MKLIALTALTMVAFAANSILNRAGVASGGISAEQFAAVRVVSGTLVLAILLLARAGGEKLAKPNLWAVFGLALYLVGFSQAYIALDAGLGALLLFGGVQVTMFAGALVLREQVPVMRWVGMVVSFAGLVWLTGNIGEGGVGSVAVLFMLAAAVGWGIYSLIGRGATDPIRSTTWNFVGASVVVLAVTFMTGSGLGGISGFGYVTAIASGAIASALGYALWYAVLPQIAATQAAVAQLSVPVIAFAGGVLFLGETITLAQLGAGVVVLGGIALSLWPQAR